MRTNAVHRARQILLLLIVLAFVVAGVSTWQSLRVGSGPAWLQTFLGTTPVLWGRHIGIISGHSGNDSGAVCPDGLTEAAVNRIVAEAAARELKRRGAQVDLLAEFDTRLHDYRADALVAIHADSCTVNLSGFKVASLEDGNQTSSRLNSCLWERYEAVTGLPRHPDTITADMRDYHAFRTIARDTPAAIIEIGFLKGDRAFLTGEPERAATGIVDGIICFLTQQSQTIPGGSK